jgi:hypothetical protein
MSKQGAEHIADAVARPHGHATGERRHRQPGTGLAIEPGREIAGVGLDPRKTVGEQRQPVEALRVAIGVGLARTNTLDAVVDRADAG